MKLTKVILTIATTLGFVGCATTKYKAYSSPENFKSAIKSVQGKTPKQAAEILGKPMSAYFKDGDRSNYYMVYPMSEGEVGMTDIMFNDRMECLNIIFEKDKGYKFDNWWSNTGFTCGAIKGQQLDMSLIEN